MKFTSTIFDRCQRSLAATQLSCDDTCQILIQQTHLIQLGKQKCLWKKLKSFSDPHPKMIVYVPCAHVIVRCHEWMGEQTAERSSGRMCEWMRPWTINEWKDGRSRTNGCQASWLNICICDVKLWSTGAAIRAYEHLRWNAICAETLFKFCPQFFPQISITPFIRNSNLIAISFCSDPDYNQLIAITGCFHSICNMCVALYWPGRETAKFQSGWDCDIRNQ